MLILILMVNLLFLYFIAFAHWPADKVGGNDGQASARTAAQPRLA